MELSRQTTIISDSTENSRIVSGSLSLSEILCEGDIKFGKFCIDMFECQIYDDGEGFAEDYTGKNIAVKVYGTKADARLVASIDGKHIRVVNESNEDILLSGDFEDSLFTGIVDSCTKDYTNSYRQITAYSFNRQNENVADFFTSFWKNKKTSTLKQVRQALMSYMGIAEVTTSLYNDSLTVYPVSATSITFEYLISSICELQLCFPHINRSGNMEYITLGTSTWELDDLYEINNSTWDTLNVEPITGIAVYSTSDDLTVSTSDVSNPYIISGNLFFAGMKIDQQIKPIINSMLTKIKSMSLTYRPCELSMVVSDLDIALGDKLTYNGNTSYVMSNRLYGVQYVDQTLQCTGSIKRDTTVDTVNNEVIAGLKRSAIEQTAEMIHWIVESGDSASSFTLTDRTADLVAQYFNISGNVEIDGSILVNGSVSGEKVRTGIIQSTNGNTYWNLNTGEFQMRSGSLKLGQSYKTEITNQGVTNYYRTLVTTETLVGVIDGSASLHDLDTDKYLYGINMQAPYTNGIIFFDTPRIAVRLGGSGLYTTVPADQSFNVITEIHSNEDGTIGWTNQTLHFMNGWLTTPV